MTLHIKVRVDANYKVTPFLMTVTGASYCADFTERFATHDAVWAVARRISETERDHLTVTGPGW